MRIGELARLTGVSTRLLRYYGEQGLLEPDRSAAGYREYREGDQIRVRQIRGLLAAGLSTRVIAEILPCASGPVPALEACPDLLATLRGELAELDTRIAELTRSRQALAGYLDTAAPTTGPSARAYAAA
ncbi:MULTISPECIES: MerR family transcriptional regulator [unclassified Kitasatospora]|uniref:MerR family transcriptional regulator n=1 Tax=unclassified Kitasatospora TaxID=2633591 RepID=UPI002E309AAC|nr:MerR family transcriptional regulator [Kitasatospora sp. NBC_01246]